MFVFFCQQVNVSSIGQSSNSNNSNSVENKKNQYEYEKKENNGAEDNILESVVVSLKKSFSTL